MDYDYPTSLLGYSGAYQSTPLYDHYDVSDMEMLIGGKGFFKKVKKGFKSVYDHVLKPTWEKVIKPIGKVVLKLAQSPVAQTALNAIEPGLGTVVDSSAQVLKSAVQKHAPKAVSNAAVQIIDDLAKTGKTQIATQIANAAKLVTPSPPVTVSAAGVPRRKRTARIVI